MPRTNLATHRLDRILADRREEAHEVLTPLVLGQPRTELIPQERERCDLMIVTSVGVLAGYDARLARVQLQTDLRQPGSDSIPHLARLPRATAVHHRVITVAFERNVRELPDHPRIERVVHEHVSQQGGNRRALR